MINVAIVEDVKTIRDGIKTIVDSSKELNCVEVFESFEDFLNFPNPEQVDVILIDIILPGVSGIDGIKQLKKISDDYTIIVLTVYEENESIFEAIMAGASGYLTKNTSSLKMIQLISDAFNGKVSMNSFIARKAIHYLKKRNELGSLSNSEKEVLNKLVEGQSLKAIEKSLAISIDQIRYNFNSIYSKLHDTQSVKYSAG
jgi:DNA-binding NarL/FixJ family response regulator